MKSLPQHIEAALKEFDEKFPVGAFVTHHMHTEKEASGGAGLDERRRDAIKSFLSTQLQALAAEMVKCLPPEDPLENSGREFIAHGAEKWNACRNQTLKNLSDFIGH